MVRCHTGKDHSHCLQKPWEEGTAHSEHLQSFLLCLFHPGTWGSELPLWKAPYRFPRILGRSMHNLPWLISPALYSLTYQTLVYPSSPWYTYSSCHTPLLCINVLLKTQQANEICKAQEVPEAQEIHKAPPKVYVSSNNCRQVEPPTGPATCGSCKELQG